MHCYTEGEPLARIDLFYDCYVLRGKIANAEPTNFDDVLWRR
jgi:hypothetical protein